MSKPFRVMLATAVESIDSLRYPLMASPKLDGIRAYVRDGKMYSRSNKLIPNRWVQEVFGHSKYNGLDGELIVGEATAVDCFRRTSHGVMSRDGAANARWFIFDRFDSIERFQKRLASAHSLAGGLVVAVPHRHITNPWTLSAYEDQKLKKGHEGVMLRDPDGPYKQGRSTLKEGYLLKLKRFTDAEAVVVGYEEFQHNDNEATVSETGHAKRSSHKANMRAGGKLGALVVKPIYSETGGCTNCFGTGVVQMRVGAHPCDMCNCADTDDQFNIGTGFNEAERVHLWENREALFGRVVKYKRFEIGVKDAPRHPVFLGFRDKRDM